MKRLLLLLFIITFVLAATAVPNNKPKPTASSGSAPTDTGNNANFNKISRDGKPSSQVCKIANLPPTNGQQSKTPGVITCSDTQLGEIPDIFHMVSTVILTPESGQTIKANKPFNISTRNANLNLGFFDNPETQYYKFSQQLDVNGFIMGHQHVTIQKILDPSLPMDPKQIAFFKGLNSQSTNNGVLSVSVDNGLPPGDYRACTMSSSFAHQPVVMPVAQRGAQDDCVRFKVR